MDKVFVTGRRCDKKDVLKEVDVCVKQHGYDVLFPIEFNSVEMPAFTEEEENKLIELQKKQIDQCDKVIIVTNMKFDRVTSAIYKYATEKHAKKEVWFIEYQTGERKVFHD